MANFKTHFVTGAAVGVVLNIVKQSGQKLLSPNRDFSWGELIVWGALGGVAASVPDILEPANTPNHRGFFHSFVFALLVLTSMNEAVWDGVRPERLHVVRLSGWAYLSHLGLDIITPMGLPFV